MEQPLQKECGWGSRYTIMLVLLCQLMGTDIFHAIPNSAVAFGAMGNVLTYVIGYIILGIPLMYMEFAISQFTSRDCLEVWKARACLSHIGHLQVVCQIILILYNHIFSAFMLHYFFLSFEHKIPYYTCGAWSTSSCNILKDNYTVNQDCMTRKTIANYCSELHETYSEYQYWRYYILGCREAKFYINWTVSLASAISCLYLCFCCFKGRQSVKWILQLITFYPLCVYSVLFIRSMSQKGVVVAYGNAIDSDFRVFRHHASISKTVERLMFTLKIGTGTFFNIASSTSFRCPCYSNIVIVMAICSGLTVMSIITTTLMVCPYAFAYDVYPRTILRYSKSMLFEVVPKLLYYYDDRPLWLILLYSSNSVMALNSNVILLVNMQGMIMKRFEKLADYPGLVIFALTTLLFFATIPALGCQGLYLCEGFRNYVTLVALFLTVLECVVFVFWYGLGRFSEDVHFMLGFRPKSSIKTCLIISCVFLVYTFCYVLFSVNMKLTLSWVDKIWFWFVVISLSVFTFLIIFKLLIAAFQHRYLEKVRLDISWGPQDEVLWRSRAMFTARAMTKEYLYRQYHLQAKIIERQKRANVRSV